MLYLHPLAQILAILLALYALALAWPRVSSLHLGRKRIFRRPRHILVGRLALGLMILGALGGLVVARLYWRGWLVTGGHGWLGLAMLALMLFGLVSGQVLAAAPRTNKTLALVHGLNNLLVLGLALVQFWTGQEVIEQFIQGV